MEEDKESPTEDDPRTRRVKPGEFTPFKDEEGNSWMRHCGQCTPLTDEVKKKFPGVEFTGSLCEKCEKELYQKLDEIEQQGKNG